MLERLVEMLGGHGLHVGYAFVFCILVLCGFGLPMPEDVVLATGGVLAWLASDLEQVTAGAMIRDQGLLTMVAVGLAGIVAGDSIIFLAGRRFGHRIADIRPLRRIITPAKLESVEKLIRRRGNLVVVIARFLPGLRALAREASRFSHYILIAVGVVLFALWARWVQSRRAPSPAAAPEAERD